MKIRRHTAALASAYLLVAGVGVGQTQNSESSIVHASNFYITTPQTGERTAVGTNVNSATGRPAARAGASGQIMANTYLSQTMWQKPSASNEAAQTRVQRPQQNGQTASSAAQPNRRGYSVQQVSNVGSAASLRQAAANYSANQTQARQQQTTQRTVSASAQAANFYRQPTTERVNPAYVSNASQEKQGLFSRIFHKHDSGQQQQQPPTGVIRQVSNAASRVGNSVAYRASKLNGKIQEGVASWYGSDFDGGPTASGEKYDMDSMTAAHKSLPFGTIVKVKNERNGRECVVRINNRGPFTKGRILDLSHAAARKLDMVGSGIARIKMEVVGRS